MMWVIEYCECPAAQKVAGLRLSETKHEIIAPFIRHLIVRHKNRQDASMIKDQPQALATLFSLINPVMCVMIFFSLTTGHTPA